MNEQRSTETRLNSRAADSQRSLGRNTCVTNSRPRITKATLETMVPDAYVNHIPVLTGGVGHEQLREFYSRHFIPRCLRIRRSFPSPETIGAERLVGRNDFSVYAHHRNGLDASRHRADRQAGGMSAWWSLSTSRRKTFERAHLLGSSFSACATRASGCSQPARRRLGDREKVGRPQLALQPFD